jgi:hypothetical protein
MSELVGVSVKGALDGGLQVGQFGVAAVLQVVVLDLAPERLTKTKLTLRL